MLSEKDCCLRGKWQRTGGVEGQRRWRENVAHSNDSAGDSRADGGVHKLHFAGNTFDPVHEEGVALKDRQQLLIDANLSHAVKLGHENQNFQLESNAKKPDHKNYRAGMFSDN